MRISQLVQGTIEARGCVAGEPVGVEDGVAGQDTTTGPSVAAPRVPLRRPVAFGFLASSVLMAFYVGVVGLAQGLEHAIELLQQDWYFVLPIIVGFGGQVGLFVYLRRTPRHLRGVGSATAVAGVGTGTSSVSMVACCAHHITDALPLIGVSGAALVLNDYRQPLMLLGIAANLVGIGTMVRTIRRTRRMQRLT